MPTTDYFSMRILKLTLAYDGTDFHGFQRLSESRSVQGDLELAWERITGEAVKTVGAGRTDAGVHALGQVVHFRTGAVIPTRNVAYALNGKLPRDMRVRRAEDVDATFHARFSATARTYHYFVRRSGRPSVFWDRFSLLEPRPLNLDAMRLAAGALQGEHDFRSFGTPEPGRPTMRRLQRVAFKEWGGWIVISLTANAFLQGMARCLTAQFLAVGRGRLTPDDIMERLRARDRGVAGKSVPPNGLFLARVHYGNGRQERPTERPNEDIRYQTERSAAQLAVD